jgi:hypothetical protein
MNAIGTIALPISVKVCIGCPKNTSKGYNLVRVMFVTCTASNVRPTSKREVIYVIYILCTGSNVALLLLSLKNQQEKR